jgi:pyrroline-5-carboxylate reductase
MSPSRLVSFIGGGNMARSLIAGLIHSGTAPAAIEVIEPQAALRESLHQQYGITVADSIASARLDASSWLLAVKPQVMDSVCSELAARLAPGQLVISIAAGITTARLQQWLGAHALVVRAMPNTPALLGAGMTGLYADPSVPAAQRALAQRILQAAGQVRWIERETLMDAVTAVSGSGPA